MRKLLCKLLKAVPTEEVYNTIEEMTNEAIIKHLHNRHVAQKSNFIAVSSCNDGDTHLAIHCTDHFKTYTAMKLMMDGGE
jgi:hypothetical protein